MEDSTSFVCDKCGEGFNPSPETFIGGKDGDTSCSPFTELEYLCEKCYKDKREKGGKL